jgi:hypothetical protein
MTPTQCYPLADAVPLLHFDVSLNEEHIFLQVALGEGMQLDLGERVHHYAMVTLARHRLADARRGVDPSGQGWIEVDLLARMLGLEPTHLNIQFFRARQQMLRALPAGVPAPALLERRRGEVRIGALGFRIMRGSALEGDYLPPCKPS